jgi:hypothetical protein
MNDVSCSLRICGLIGHWYKNLPLPNAMLTKAIPPTLFQIKHISAFKINLKYKNEAKIQKNPVEVRLLPLSG